MAMARLGIEVALLAHVSAGIYAGPHRAMLHADFEAIAAVSALRLQRLERPT
jgi:hypothetical protein